jgi:hypothetical protein
MGRFLLEGDQERHHSRKGSRDEYFQVLKRHEIEHYDRYIFKPLDRSGAGSLLWSLAGVVGPGDYKQVTPNGVSRFGGDIPLASYVLYRSARTGQF